MTDEETKEKFLEAWYRTGDEYLTRKEIARMFGFSDGWVQLMLIETQAEPRRFSMLNDKRVRLGLDFRTFNRKKNLSKYWIRRYMRMLAASEAELAVEAPGDVHVRAIKRANVALDGIERQVEVLTKIDAMDPLIKEAKALLYAYM